MTGVIALALAGLSVADEPDYMNDLNYIWPDVRDGAVEAIETSPEPEFEAEK